MFSIPGDLLLPPVYLLLSRKPRVNVKGTDREGISLLVCGHHGPGIAQRLDHVLDDLLKSGLQTDASDPLDRYVHGKGFADSTSDQSAGDSTRHPGDRGKVDDPPDQA